MNCSVGHHLILMLCTTTSGKLKVLNSKFHYQNMYVTFLSKILKDYVLWIIYIFMFKYNNYFRIQNLLFGFNPYATIIFPGWKTHCFIGMHYDVLMFLIRNVICNVQHIHVFATHSRASIIWIWLTRSLTSSKVKDFPY